MAAALTRPTLAAVLAAGLLGPCDGPTGVANGPLTGTWGGQNAGLIADDTSAHAHIACTFGNVPGGITLSGGRFDVAGEYVLRAFPVAVGPALPARFRGSVAGTTLTLRITVQDTVTAETTELGPVYLVRGAQPRMGPCPICRRGR